MSPNNDPQWLQWARALQALAQTGLTFSENHYDRERYEAVHIIAAEMMAAGSGMPVQRIRAMFEAQTGYATPKVDVRGVVFRDDGILLVKELADGGRWTLPGGWADVNEPPSIACTREVLEESGYQTCAVKLLAVYDRSIQGHMPPHPLHVYKLFFRCEISGGEATTSTETGGARFFREGEIPDLSVSRTTPAQIARLFEHYRHPQWPTDFD